MQPSWALWSIVHLSSTQILFRIWRTIDRINSDLWSVLIVGTLIFLSTVNPEPLSKICWTWSTLLIPPQSVSGPTGKRETLDLVLIYDTRPSDHFAVLFSATLHHFLVKSPLSTINSLTASCSSVVFNHFILHQAIRSSPPSSTSDPVISAVLPVVFQSFEQVFLPALTDFVQKLRTPYCPFDSVPQGLFKEVFFTIRCYGSDWFLLYVHLCPSCL